MDKNVTSALGKYGINYEILLIDPDYADTYEFCSKYNYQLENSGNTIIVSSKRGPKKYVACLVQAHMRLDVNKVVASLMGTRRASFASAEETQQMTGMVLGGVTPFGLPLDIPVYVDERVRSIEYLIVGSGDRCSKLKITTAELDKVPNLIFVSGLAVIKNI